MADATVPRAGFLRSAWANPILLLVLTTLIWAGHSIVGRLAVGQIGPMTLTCMRWAVALSRSSSPRGRRSAATGRPCARAGSI